MIFLLYINSLPHFVNNKSTPILFADDTSILFTHTDTTEFNSNTHTVFKTINPWLKNNYLSLNLKKITHCIYFKTRNNPPIDMKIGYNNKLIPGAPSTKFLGLTICSVLSWRMHIAHLTTKLSNAYYAFRSIKSLMSHKTLLLIYHSLFHTVMSYRIILWGNSCHSLHIFRIQKRVIRIIRGCGNRECCRILFKKLKVLPLMSQHILPLLYICSLQQRSVFYNFRNL